MYFFIKNLRFLLRKSIIKNTLNKFKFVADYKNITKLNFNCYNFIKLFLISEIIKKKYNSNSKNFNYDKSYTFSEDWFSSNIPVWEHFFKRELNLNSSLEYLEIGVFEGRSAIYVYNNFDNINVCCVDPYEKYEGIESSVKRQEMSKIFKTFQENTKNLGDRLKHFKMTSSKFFETNKKKFDIIYVDGSHYYLDVINDFKNSLKILKKGGLLIFDDFLWNYYEKIEENPINGILPILLDKKNLKIISASNQLIIKKVEER